MRQERRLSLLSHHAHDFREYKNPLKLWFKIGYLILTAKKGISALQLHRIIFGEESTHAYRTTWYVAMRLRAAMRGDVIRLLAAMAELLKWMRLSSAERKRISTGRSAAIAGRGGKTMVIGAIARKGNVICQAIEQLGFDTQEAFVRQAVSTKAQLVATDEHSGYRRLGKIGYQHSKSQPSSAAVRRRLRPHADNRIVTGRSSSAVSSGVFITSRMRICRSI